MNVLSSASVFFFMCNEIYDISSGAREVKFIQSDVQDIVSVEVFNNFLCWLKPFAGDITEFINISILTSIKVHTTQKFMTPNDTKNERKKTNKQNN